MDADLSQLKLSTTHHTFCPRCLPETSDDTPVALNQCAACEAHHCGCYKCLEWLHKYVKTYELHCLCAKGAARRIDQNKADHVMQDLNRYVSE